MSKNELYKRQKPSEKKESISQYMINIYMLVMMNIKLKPQRRSRGNVFFLAEDVPFGWSGVVFIQQVALCSCSACEWKKF